MNSKTKQKPQFNRNPGFLSNFTRKDYKVFPLTKQEAKIEKRKEKNNNSAVFYTAFHGGKTKKRRRRYF